MIEIKPVEDKQITRTAFEEQGIAYSEDFSYYIPAKFGDEILGIALVKILDEVIYIQYISKQIDLMLFDGILRSALHVGVTHGAKQAIYENYDMEDSYNKLGFISDAENHSLKIDKLFESCCGCGN